MRRPSRRVAAIGGVALAAAVLLTGGLAAAGRTARPATRPVERTATALTVRGDLEQRETVSGALGYGTPVTVTGRRSGTLTWLPGPGLEVDRGGTLWRVDDAPVVLFTGALPLYRTLRPAADPAEGRDVDLVASNLHRLGFWRGRTSGARYDAFLAAAVESWQRKLGEHPDGVVHPGDVVVAAGAVRVDAVQAHVAESATQPVLTLTSRSRSILLKVPADLAASLHSGVRVGVTLPSGVRCDAEVVRIAGSATGSAGSPPAVQVVVEADDRTAVRRSVLGAVTGDIATRSARDVVHVPVGALLALAGGGWALERVDHRLVRVEVGIVADGEAAVTGIGPNVRVVAAS